MLKKYGQEVVDDLMARQNETKKWTREELNEIKKYYRDKIKNGDFQSNTGLSVSEMWGDISESGSMQELFNGEREKDNSPSS